MEPQTIIEKLRPLVGRYIRIVYGDARMIKGVCYLSPEEREHEGADVCLEVSGDAKHLVIPSAQVADVKIIYASDPDIHDVVEFTTVSGFKMRYELD